MTLLSHHATDLLARLRRPYADPTMSEIEEVLRLIRTGDLIHRDEIADVLRADAARGLDLPPSVTLTPEQKDAA